MSSERLKDDHVLDYGLDLDHIDLGLTPLEELDQTPEFPEQPNIHPGMKEDECRKLAHEFYVKSATADYNRKRFDRRGSETLRHFNQTEERLSSPTFYGLSSPPPLHHGRPRPPGLQHYRSTPQYGPPPRYFPASPPGLSRPQYDMKGSRGPPNSHFPNFQCPPPGFVPYGPGPYSPSGPPRNFSPGPPPPSYRFPPRSPPYPLNPGNPQGVHLQGRGVRRDPARLRSGQYGARRYFP